MLKIPQFLLVKKNIFFYCQVHTPPMKDYLYALVKSDVIVKWHYYNNSYYYEQNFTFELNYFNHLKLVLLL